MSFSGDLGKFKQKVETRSASLFAGVVQECQRSIVEGSEITGAPGQPVQTGALKASWSASFGGPVSATIGTNLPYAQSIEEGISYAHGGKPITLRSSVGGFHSVKLTVAGFARIVQIVRGRVSGGG